VGLKIPIASVSLEIFFRLSLSAAQHNHPDRNSYSVQMLRINKRSAIVRLMQGMTKRQQQILDYITEWILEHGYPPTIREIGEHMGIRSTNGVNDHLKALERKGYLKREGLKSRALRPINMPTPIRSNVVPALIGQGEMLEVPIVGRVAAGAPILAEENVESTVRIDSFFLDAKPRDKVFALRVTGESMIDAGIHDGDYIFVRKQLEARRGQIVVAMIDGEATVKRYEPDGDVIRFCPENASMEPIVIRKEDFRSTSILGIVCGVWRRLH